MAVAGPTILLGFAQKRLFEIPEKLRRKVELDWFSQLTAKYHACQGSKRWA
jgi:hypothetical protein